MKLQQRRFNSFSFFMLETPKRKLWQKGKQPGEMQHNTTFQQGLYCLLILNQPCGACIHYNLEISNCVPLKVRNGQSDTYCININGKIQNTKG